MKAVMIAVLLALFVASTAAQSQNPPPVQGSPGSSRTGGNIALAAKGGVFKSNLGFSYSYSNDWNDLTHTKFFEALNGMEELVAKNGKDNSKRDLATRAAECRKVVMMLARPRPRGGAIVATTIPFACFGRRPSESDLPALQALAPQYATSVMNVTGVRTGAYRLGSHNVWVERVRGTPKLQPGKPSVAEIVCSMLNKAFVCWTALGDSDADLKEFEQGAVTLDDESAPELVPESASAQLENAAPPKTSSGPAATASQNDSTVQSPPDSPPKPRISVPVSPRVFTSDLGVSYSYPADWDVLDLKLLEPPRKASESSKTETQADAKTDTKTDTKADTVSRKADCHKTLLALRYSNPRPVLVLVSADPFDCTGVIMSEEGLINSVSNMSWDIKGYDLRGEVFGSYMLGGHTVRIGRMNLLGTGHPEQTRTQELVCSLVKKARLCWTAVAIDDASLKLFEQTAVVLDGESAPALVPVPAETFAAPGVYKSDFGFTFRYPSDWEAFLVRDLKPTAPAGSKSPTGPRSGQCSQMDLMLFRGKPQSEIDVWVYPYSCAKMTWNRFTQAAVAEPNEWVRENRLGEVEFGRYALGGRDFWVDRAAASPKDHPSDHPEEKVTLETACGLLKSAMVCWKGRLRDEDAMKAFEGGLTSVNDEASVPLVPASAFEKKK